MLPRHTTVKWYPHVAPELLTQIKLANARLLLTLIYETVGVVIAFSLIGYGAYFAYTHFR